MLDFDRYEWLSFDCYGTLIDWETGISDAVSAVLESHDMRLPRDEILELFAAVEPRVQTGGRYLEYRRVLRRVMAMMGIELGFRFTESDMARLADSLPSWPIFPDTRAALGALKARHKLAIISNVDDDLFARTARVLGVEMDAVITSQQARSYKPDLRNFRMAQERMGVDKGRWLHVAESLYHDVSPANALGIDSVWVNRGGEREGGGATRPTDAAPDLTVPNLAALVEAMGLGGD